MSEDKKPLTIWQKVKLVTALFVAIGGVITAGAGAYKVYKSISDQSNVQETTYNIFAKRFEEMAVKIAVLENELEHVGDQCEEIEDEMKSIHNRRFRDEPESAADEPDEGELISNSGGGVGVVEMVESPAMVTMSVEDDEEEPPVVVQYKGKAKLPDFNNIQQVVQQAAKPMKKDAVEAW